MGINFRAAHAPVEKESLNAGPKCGWLMADANPNRDRDRMN